MVSIKRMISAALRHWRPVLRRTYQEYRDDHVSIVASGVAFRVIIAVFPAIALMVWLGTEVLGSTGVRGLMHLISGLVPDSSRQLITQAFHSSLHNNPADRNGEYKALGAVAPIVGLAFMIYSANSGMRALFSALNLIYDTEERRSFVRFTAITLLFTAGTLVTIMALAAGGVVAPVLLGASGFSSLILLSLRLLRWPVLFVGAAIALALLYRYAPHRDREVVAARHVRQHDRRAADRALHRAVLLVHGPVCEPRHHLWIAEHDGRLHAVALGEFLDRPHLRGA